MSTDVWVIVGSIIAGSLLLLFWLEFAAYKRRQKELKRIERRRRRQYKEMERRKLFSTKDPDRKP